MDKMVDFLMKYGEMEIRKVTLEAWVNPYPMNNYEINIDFPEFTCLCPRSGYPDFAVVKIRYVPDKKIVELRSLKLYFNSFRGAYISHEDAINTIYFELERKLKPRFIEVIGDFNPRGNLKTIVKVSSDMQGKTKKSYKSK